MADNFASDYMQQQRLTPERQAGDELLSRYGLDASGMEQPKAQVTAAPTAQIGAVDLASQSAERIRKIKADQAKEPQPSFLKDVVGGTLAEIPRALVGGVTDAVKEMLHSADSLAGFFESVSGTKKGGAFGAASKAVPELVGKQETPGGQLLRGITQFATGYATGGKMAESVGVTAKTLKMFVSGGFSDAAAFDPNDPNISNLINEMVPALKNPLTEFLATQPNDNEALNRFKRAAEGLGLGAAMEGVIGLARNLRARFALKRAETAFEQARTAAPTKAAEPAPAPQAVPIQATDQTGIVTQAAPPSAASQIDVVRPPLGSDIRLGNAGTAGVMQADRKLLPAPGQGVLTVDEIAANLEREAKARRAIEGNPTLAAAHDAITLREEIRGNATLRAAQETMLRGKSEEEIASKLLASEGDSIRSILKDQGGQISQDAMYALARGAVGGAIGLTQGDTTEERIKNGILLAGLGAAIKPSLINRLIGAMERVAPREMGVIKSFDPPALETTAKGVTRQPRGNIGPVQVASEAQVKEFLAADPAAIKVGDKAIKIKWDEVGSPESIDNIIKTVTDLNRESIDVARRGVQSDVKRQQLANMLGVTEEDMLRRRRGQALNSEQTQAFIDVYGSALKELDTLATAMKSGQNVENEFRLHLGRTTALTEQIFGARAEAGRALRVWGQAAQSLQGPTQLSQQVDLLRVGGRSIEEIPASRLADMILALNTPAQKTTFLTQALHLGKNAALEACMNGLLSNPTTHVANIISNSITTFSGIAERSIAGTFGHEVARGEATAMIDGILGGWRDALDIAKRSFVTGESQLGLGFTKMENVDRAISGANLGIGGQMGRAVDMLGSLISMPGRALMASDDFFKGINYRAELNAQAWRQASKEGLTGGALKTRAAELAHDLDFVSLVKDQAENFAFYQTFNQHLGTLGEGYIGFLGEHPWMRILTPFVRTPVNIAKYTLERTPLVSLAMNQVRADLVAGGVKRDLALAKMATGGMIFGTATALAMNGSITGGGPKNGDLRDLKRTTGWQPYSLKVGDTYVSYARTDPIGFVLGMGADIVEKGGELKNGELDGLAVAAITAMHDTFVSKTYLSGLMNVIDMLNSPEHKGEKYFQKLAGSLVPAGVAQLKRQLDPILRETNSAADEIFSRLPGFSTSLPPRRNIWGEPIQLEGGIGPDLISPFYTSTKIDDPVSDEILRLKIPIPMWRQYVYGTQPSESVFAKDNPNDGVKLLPAEYDRMVQLAGNELKLGGKTLHERLSGMIASPSYAQQGVLAKEALIRQTFSQYGKAAVQQLVEEFPDLKSEIQINMNEKRQGFAPENQ